MPKFEPIDREEVRREFEQLGSTPDHATMVKIGERLGVHPDSVRRVLRDYLRIIPARVPADPEKLRQADAMLDGTIPKGEVAKTVGLTYNQIEVHFRGRGLRRENYGAYRVAKALEERLL